MKPASLMFAGLAVLLFGSHARAEYRSVLVRIEPVKNKQSRVTIYSDVKQEQKSSISVDEAVKVIAGMKGWGSGVGVYVVGEGNYSRAARRKLFAAIDDNLWLDLVYFGDSVPKSIAAHFLKEDVKKPAPAPRPVRK